MIVRDNQSSEPWFRSVQVGDMLVPNRLCNDTERGPNHLAVPTKVLGRITAQSQSGVLFRVRTINGQDRWLDAAWFQPAP